MNLSTSVIFDYLAQMIPVKQYGVVSDDLVISSILFYQVSSSLKPGHTYFLNKSSFPKDEPVVNNILILCHEEDLPANREINNYCVFTVDNSMAAEDCFNLMQKMFEFYDNWNESLYDSLHKDNSIKKMLESSVSVFENRITVMNKHMEVLYNKSYTDSKSVDDDFKSIPLDCIKRVMAMTQKYGQLRQPYLHDDDGSGKVYTINLYTEDNYYGSVSLSEAYRPFRKSDFVLFDYFTHFIEEAMQYQYAVRRVQSKFAPLKHALYSILDGNYQNESIISKALREMLGIENLKYTWCCFAIRTDASEDTGFTEYELNYIWKALPQGVAFRYDNFIVTVIYLLNSDSLQSMIDKLLPLLRQMGSKMGVSDTFASIFDLRTAYDKAINAVNIGAEKNPDNNVYVFSDCILQYMLQHSVGTFSVFDLITPKLKLLFKHDQESETNYLETLYCYLSNHLNMSKTAKELFIHRSTLEQRLQIIYKLLGCHLETENEQLYYWMILKIIGPGDKDPIRMSTKITSVKTDNC